MIQPVERAGWAMFSSKAAKNLLVSLLLLCALAAAASAGFHLHALRWGVQAYLGQMLNAKARIQTFHGGLFSGIVLDGISISHARTPTPFLTIDQVSTDISLFGKKAGSRYRCTVSAPRLYLEECMAGIRQFSLPTRRSWVFLPRSGLWARCHISVTDGAIVESGNRPDNVFMRDLGGTVMPAAGRQTVEFFLGTDKNSSCRNRLQAYGSVQAAKDSSNLDFEISLEQLETCNVFLKSFHVLKGTAQLEGKVRSGNLESASMELRDLDLFFPKDKRVWNNMLLKLTVNDKYISIRECQAQGEGFRFHLTGDVQRLSFQSGRVNVENLIAKADLLSEGLSREAIRLNIQTGATLYYRSPQTMMQLRWEDDILQSLSLLEGTIGVDETVELAFKGRYAPGLSLLLDYRLSQVDFEKIKADWFGKKLGSLFHGSKITGEGKAQCEWDRVGFEGTLDWDGNKMPYKSLWADRRFQLENVRVDEATTLTGTLDLEDRDKSGLTFDFQNESISRFVRATGAGKPSMTGKFTGKLALQGNLLDPAIEGSLDLRNGTLKGIPFHSGNLRLSGRFPRVYLDESVLYVKRDMPVNIRGFIDLSDKDVFRNVDTEMNRAMPQPAA